VRHFRAPGRYYVVRRGDMLPKIARHHYARGAEYGRFRHANRMKIRNSNLIYPRRRLYIP
jgi:nucleoid-associated protein YgaU